MSFAYAAAAIAVIAAGVSAAAQADAAQKQADYQAAVEENNAKIAAWQRSDALQRGEQEAARSMQEQAQLIGTQRARLAASGQDVTEGSAQDIIATTRYLGQQDVATLQSNAAREAWGYDVQGANAQSSAAFERWRAKNNNPAVAGVMAAGTTLLSSASLFAKKGS